MGGLYNSFLSVSRNGRCNKRKLIAGIRKGIAGRVATREGEMEGLITTKPKTGYRLNCDREDILILRKGDYNATSLIVLLALHRIWSDCFDWLLESPPMLFLS